MVKYGMVHFRNTDQQFQVIWTYNQVDFERIDLIEDIKDYDLVDTTNCNAAYYKKNKEMVYGDETLIQGILKARSVASLFHAKQERSVEIKDGAVWICVEKENAAIGMKFRLLTKNGRIAEEYYETPDIILNMNDVEPDRGIEFVPINITCYQPYQIVDGIKDTSSDSVEYYSLDYLKSKYGGALDHIEDDDFIVVDNLETARERLRLFKNANTKYKAVDLETTGVDTSMLGVDVITGIVLSYDVSESTYYPFRQDKCENLPISFMADILEAINSQPKDVLILAHNGKFEIQGIWKEEASALKHSPYPEKYNPNYLEEALQNTFLRIDRDTFILSTLVNPVMKKGIHTLKSLVFKATGKFYLELDQIFKDQIKFNVLPPDLIKYYACPDAPNTIKVFQYLIERLPKDEMGIFELECKLIYVKAINEWYGMRTNKALLIASIENEEYKVKTLREYFQSIHKTNKNINSPDVKKDIIYNKLRCPVEVRTKTNQPSTSALAVERIVELGTRKESEYANLVIPPPIRDLNEKEVVKGIDLISNKYPSMVVLQKYNKATKELGALNRIKRKSISDRVMFGINQTGAASGRQTSDAHQYSDAMKKLVIADSKYHHLWSCDYKQIELRVLSYLANETELIEMERDPDIDIHRAILSKITGKEIWDISAEERSDGKSVNFGVVYMMSAFGLAKKKKGPAYTKDDYVTALTAINNFYNGLQKVKEFVANNESYIRENGYIKTVTGRYRYFKEILDNSLPEDKKQSMIRAGNNTPVQGFAADLMKLSEVLINQYIIKMGWDKKVDCDGMMLPLVRMMLSIHDEVLVSSHETIPIEEIIIMFKECMEIEVKGAPPFFAAPAMVDCWLDGKKDSYEIPITLRNEIITAWKRDKKSIIHAETYLQDLNHYRKTRLKDYMNLLITKYKVKEEVAKHVRHPDLTHVLISTFIDAGKHPEDEGLSHLQRIDVAVQRYMETDSIDLTNYIKSTEAEVEEELCDQLSSYSDLENYVQFDENGEAIIADCADEEDNLDTVKDYKKELSDTIERSYVVYLLDEVIIDFSDFQVNQDSEEMNQEIAKLSNPKNPYRVVYMIETKLYQTNLRIGYVPKIIDEIVKRHL